MNVQIGDWGCVHDLSYVAEGSLELFKNEHLAGAAMVCKDASGNEAILALGDSIAVSINSKGFDRLPTPEYVWGEAVTVADKGIEGVVSEICWHRNEKRYFYHIDCAGKRQKKRYFAEDLERL